MTLTNIELDKGQYGEWLGKALDYGNRQAAKRWLRAVLTKVPVFTGEARGSLRPLGEFIKQQVPIHPVAIRKGHNAAYGAEQSHFEFKGGTYFQEFIFTVSVVHYLINEFYDVNPPIHLTHLPRPWFSFATGKAAYSEYIKQYIKKNIPEIGSFMKRTTVQLNEGRIFKIASTPAKPALRFLEEGPF